MMSLCAAQAFGQILGYYQLKISAALVLINGDSWSVDVYPFGGKNITNSLPSAELSDVSA